jgi:hypothetical protein
MWVDIIAGVVGNILTVLLTLAGGWFLWLAVGRRALRRFWGIGESKQIRIYISNLNLLPGGAVDSSGTPRTARGPVVSQSESEMAGLLKNLFFASFQGAQFDWVRALLLIEADVTVVPAPDSVAAIAAIERYGTVVTLGSPGYNPISGAIERDYKSPVRFINDNRAIQLPGNFTTDDPRHCFVVRLMMAGRFWFYVAGLDGDGTAGAAYYLATSWRRLDKRYQKSPSFYVALERVGDDFRNSRVVAEGSLDLWSAT